nr:immunoglobulin heavy chain junction region [Mus musculus]NSM04164.1 immunoglobulin heavy chain junction region [Mus musculus]NSM04398.1 immunoglobulin heavy chain junction region [Mus musculus]NSM04825.1 immunoglobulin heavy chain junction region [Mus musculus]NSM05957.1 immunoglobulin heavy chain junction region [Mus musculus]
CARKDYYGSSGGYFDVW